jgi:hypothetical protein
MGVTLEGSIVARDDNAGKLHVTAVISHLAFEALRGDETDPGQVTVRMESSLRFYLGEKSGQHSAAWPYPDFLRGSETQKDVQVEFDVEEELWREFENEAAAQGVSVEQLAEHAAFYFAAELNAGRLTERILEDLDSNGEDEQA